ncbi:MAG: hypothetical protein J0M12_06620 [Deltaproteobacteria bacterium]|nr:hypothetical protein [Deltaproteobacteria bacterium]
MTTSFATLETRASAQTRPRGKRRHGRGQAAPRPLPSYLDPSPLGSALERCNISPFTDSSVDAYKEGVVDRSARRFVKAKDHLTAVMRINAMADKGLSGEDYACGSILLLCVSLLTSIVSLGIGCLVSWGLMRDLGFLWAIPIAYLGNAAGLLFFIGGTLLCTRLRPAFIRRWSDVWYRAYADRHPRLAWQCTPLADYGSQIPCAVQGVIERLQTECPAGTKFEVDHVCVAAVPNTTEIRDAAKAWANDPFLWVTYGNERYAVAVWDERGYRVANP